MENKKIKRERQVTHRQEVFCQAVHDGLTRIDAYKRAYSMKSNDNVIGVAAARLYAMPHIQKRIAELKEMLVEKQLWSREESVNVLAAGVRDAEIKFADKISAIKELNLMHGYNAAIKHETNTIARIVIVGGKAEIEQTEIGAGSN